MNICSFVIVTTIAFGCCNENIAFTVFVKATAAQYGDGENTDDDDEDGVWCALSSTMYLIFWRNNVHGATARRECEQNCRHNSCRCRGCDSSRREQCGQRRTIARTQFFHRAKISSAMEFSSLFALSEKWFAFVRPDCFELGSVFV